ncbi:MAG: adenylate kinase [Longimicrobiales bacterium]|nr:adenylate kinase [Longimicrobiales bacterium]
MSDQAGMIVVLLGPPGVGKGTQGARLCESLGLRHVATGDLLRAARREGTALGREAQEYMDRGALVPDEVIVRMVEEVLAGLKPGRGVVLDGFPRTVPQARSLQRMLAGLGRRVDRVLLLEAPDEVLVQRISGRRSCPECGALYNVHFSPPATEGRCDRCGGELTHRADDTPGTVRNRLEVYRQETEPLVDFYREGDAVLHRVEGDQPVEAVQADLERALR